MAVTDNFLRSKSDSFTKLRGFNLSLVPIFYSISDRVKSAAFTTNRVNFNSTPGVNTPTRQPRGLFRVDVPRYGFIVGTSSLCV